MMEGDSSDVGIVCFAPAFACDHGSWRSMLFCHALVGWALFYDAANFSFGGFTFRVGIFAWNCLISVRFGMLEVHA